MATTTPDAQPRAVGRRAMLPREHGLWCWAFAPLLGAFVLAPRADTALAAAAIVGGFGAVNAARARALTVAAIAGGLGVGLAGLAAAGMTRPALWLAAFGAFTVGAGAAAWSAGRRVGRAVTFHTAYELAAIVGFAAIAGAAAVGAGAEGAGALASGLGLVTWEVVGLWWVRGRLAHVLPGRDPWRVGPAVAGCVWALAAVAAWGAGVVAAALVPAGYAARTWLTRPVTSGRDARRVGLTEAAWATAVSALLGWMFR